MRVVASYLYSGMPDYWSGNGRRWDNDAGCVFAHYDGKTGMRDLIESAVDDFNMGGDFYPSCDGPDPWEDVTEDDVRAALLDCLTDSGRADYEENRIWEGAAEYAAINGFNCCRECGARVDEEHYDDCDLCNDQDDLDGGMPIVEEGDCEPDYEYFDSPVCIFLLELTEDN